MITGVDLAASPALLEEGLTLMEAAPVSLPDHASGQIDQEGPLALDYRTWADPTTAPVMASPNDVTYTLRWTKVSYDGRVYQYAYASVDDK